MKKDQVAVLSIYSWADSTKKLLNQPDFVDKHAETAKEFFCPLNVEEMRFEYNLIMIAIVSSTKCFPGQLRHYLTKKPLMLSQQILLTKNMYPLQWIEEIN